MKIFKYNNKGGVDHDASSLTRLSATVSNGLATIRRRIYFVAEAPNEDAMDILSLPEFPAQYSAHPRHPAFKYYGNAEIQPLSESSQIWQAELEYSTSDPNATDEDGNAVTSETKPWKLKPDNIQFVYPEVVVPFKVSYNSTGKLYDKDGNAIRPVRNSAGDVIPAERSVRNMQLNFTFAALNWDIMNSITYGNSVNEKEIKVCGLTIPAKRGLLLPPECSYTTVYKEGSRSVKWQYWTVQISIMIDMTGLLLERKLLDVGDRAKFNAIDLTGDALLAWAKIYDSSLSTILKATPQASQICHFRLTEYVPLNDGKILCWPTGKLIFCSWDQYLAARRLYIQASEILMDSKKTGGKPKLDSIYELNCEQDTQMPLNNGYLYTKAIDGASDYVSGTAYKTRTFREFPIKSWSALNLPKKGIKW